MSGNVKEKFDPSQIGKTISLLSSLYEKLQDPRIARDPAVKALVQGLNRQDNDFKVSSMTVAVLRNAGCIGTNAPVKTEQARSVIQPNGRGQQTKGPETQAPTKKLRGFARSIDYLLASAVIPDDFRPLKRLRELRGDGSKVLKIEKEDGTIVERKISQVDDFDLLFLLDKPNYDALMSAIGDWQNPRADESGFHDSPFGFWNQDSSAPEFIAAISEKVSGGKENELFQEGKLGGHSSLARTLKGTVMNKILQVLKDAVIPKGDVNPDGEAGIALYRMVVDTLIREVWFKFGKSPTLKTISK